MRSTTICGFVGPGYGIPTEACVEAVKLFARTEGVVLDPVYTGKAAAGMIAHIREGRYGKETRWCLCTPAGRQRYSPGTAFGDEAVGI